MAQSKPPAADPGCLSSQLSLGMASLRVVPRPAEVPRDALSELKARIRAIERSGTADPACPGPRFLAREDGGGKPRVAHDAALPSSPPLCSQPQFGWRLGAARLDRHLSRTGLELGAVHEIKPQRWGELAARAFALALLSRRLQAGDAGAGGPVLWCEARRSIAEHGALHGPGFAAFGIPPERLVIVEPAHARDVLWAMEEALGSGAAALVAGQIDEADLTPARRLALAAARSGTPCLLLTHAQRPPAAATATRWRIGAHKSAPHPFDPAAPGAAQFTVAIERCRASPPAVSNAALVLEWSDVAYRFRLAAAVADRAHEAGSAHRAGRARN